MNGSCLQVKVSMEPLKLKVSATEYCGLGIGYVPLLVDEGFLLVDFKGSIAKLFVKRK